MLRIYPRLYTDTSISLQSGKLLMIALLSTRWELPPDVIKTSYESL